MVRKFRHVDRTVDPERGDGKEQDALEHGDLIHLLTTYVNTHHDDE
jgi:hypothetical protein